MTIQNWSLRPDAAVVVCDTIVTHMESNRPMAAMSKAWVVPHRSVMLAAGMWAYPAMTLYSNLALGHGPESFGDLASYAAEVLQEAASGYSQQEDWQKLADAVLFGWKEAANTIEGWRFEARDDYRPTPMLPDGEILFVPPLIAPAAGTDWISIALQQQVEDLAVPAFDRNNIGGHLICYEMKTNAEGLPPKIEITNHGRLPHYEAQISDARAFADEMKLSRFEVMQGG